MCHFLFNHHHCAQSCCSEGDNRVYVRIHVCRSEISWTENPLPLAEQNLQGQLLCVKLTVRCTLCLLQGSLQVTLGHSWFV